MKSMILKCNLEKKGQIKKQKGRILTILTAKNFCFTEFSTKINWNTRLAASDVFLMFTQSIKFF